MKKTFVYIGLVVLLAMLAFLVGRGSAQEAPFSVSLEPIPNEEDLYQLTFTPSCVGTAKIGWLRQGEALDENGELPDDIAERPGLGENDCAAKQNWPTIRKNEWISGQVPENGQPVQKVFVLVRGEGGWGNAEQFDITDLIFGEQTEATAEVAEIPTIGRTFLDRTVVWSSNDQQRDQVAALYKGQEFSIETQENGWTMVPLSNGESGWIRSDEVEPAEVLENGVRRYTGEDGKVECVISPNASDVVWRRDGWLPYPVNLLYFDENQVDFTTMKDFELIFNGKSRDINPDFESADTLRLPATWAALHSGADPIWSDIRYWNLVDDDCDELAS